VSQDPADEPAAARDENMHAVPRASRRTRLQRFAFFLTRIPRAIC
jgi:hypothetical protein